MRRCLKIIVTGLVQGVGYRDFVKDTARRLGVEGTIQNSGDGSVVIFVRGEVAQLEDLIDELYRGTKRSSIQSVCAESFFPDRDFRGVFRVIGSE